MVLSNILGHCFYPPRPCPCPAGLFTHLMNLVRQYLLIFPSPYCHLHTCDQTRYRQDLPILGPQIRVTPDRPKLPIYMNSDFSLCQKLKLVFRSPQTLALSKFTTGSGSRTFWFSATGKSMYRLRSINKNQHFFQTFDWLLGLYLY